MRIGDVSRPPAEVIKAFERISTPTLSNAMDKLGIHGVLRGFRPVVPGMRCVGSAFTVHEATGELGSADPAELPLGELVDATRAGDVVVIDNGGAAVSTWGGVVTYAAKQKGVAGLVVDGGVRDLDDIRDLAFPTFARHVVPTTGKGRVRVLAINGAIRAGGVAVRPGDIVVGDDSGVVSVPQDQAEQVLDLARKQDATDQKVRAGIRDGLSVAEAMRRVGVR